MENAKLKELTTSTLTEIAGIGEVKAKKLLLAFDGMKAIREATAEDLARVPGISERDANAIYAFYHDEKKGADKT